MRTLRNSILLLLVIGSLAFSSCSQDETVLATLSFSVTDTNTSAGSSITFENESVGFQNYAWDFGDGNSSTSEEATHTFEEIGIYTVTLSGVNSETNETETTTKEIHVLLFNGITREEGTISVSSPAADLKFLTKDAESGAIAWYQDFESSDNSNVFKATRIASDLAEVNTVTIRPDLNGPIPSSIQVTDNQYYYGFLGIIMRGNLDLSDVSTFDTPSGFSVGESWAVEDHQENILVGVSRNLLKERLELYEYSESFELQNQAEHILTTGKGSYHRPFKSSTSSHVFMVTEDLLTASKKMVLVTINPDLTIDEHVINSDFDFSSSNLFITKVTIQVDENDILYVNITYGTDQISDSVFLAIDLSNNSVLDETRISNPDQDIRQVLDLAILDEDNIILLTNNRILLRNTSDKSTTIITEFDGGGESIAKIANRTYAIGKRTGDGSGFALTKLVFN